MQLNYAKNIWYNGRLVPWNKAQTHVFSHGLNVSGSVFEGIRIYNGQPFYLREHLVRLFKSAELIGFKISYQLEVIEDAITELIDMEHIKTGYVRPLAWVANQTPAVFCNNSDVSVAIIVLDLKSPFTEKEIASGLSLETSTFIRPAFNMSLWQSKASAHYITSCGAIRVAKSHGYDDALILDSRGYVTESSGSNIFMVKEDVLYTPTPDCFLNGITRQIIIKLAKEIGLPVVEKHITPKELMSADEIFLTGTAYEIIGVRQIDGVMFCRGKTMNSLQTAFNDLTRTLSLRKEHGVLHGSEK